MCKRAESAEFSGRRLELHHVTGTRSLCLMNIHDFFLDGRVVSSGQATSHTSRFEEDPNCICRTVNSKWPSTTCTLYARTSLMHDIETVSLFVCGSIRFNIHSHSVCSVLYAFL